MAVTCFPSLRPLVFKAGLYTLFLCCVVILDGCTPRGRVVVILDNSGSMAKAGMPFDEIKDTLVRALYLFPSSYEVGLRVFDERTNSSTRIVDYTRDLNAIRTALLMLQPKSGTFIGPSLLDATRDLLAAPQGNNRLILITDGEGADSDVAQAHEARRQLQPVMDGFKCYFILFSTRRNVRAETPIGKVADILGCNLTVPQEGDSAPNLETVLQQIASLDLSLIWLILSFTAYMTLFAWTARLIFSVKLAQRILVRRARAIATGCFLLLGMAAAMAHFVGIIGRLSPYVWLLMGLGTLSLVILWMLDSLGMGAKPTPQRARGEDDDPFR